MANIFISYSRKDIVFARRLKEELERRELDVWVDLEDIPPTVDWMKEIQKNIEEADDFLFIISPNSITSKVCKEELELAVKNGKRLLPVVAHEIKWDDAHSELSKLNYIFFRESDDFEAALEKLLAAINTDYEWVQTHRRLQVKALEWERGNRDNGFLLRGRDLEEAEQYFSIYITDPHPTAIQRAYLLKSRQATDRQRRITIGVLGFIILMLIGASVYLVTPRIQEAIAKNQARGDLILIPAGPSVFGINNDDSIAGTAVPLQKIVLPTFYIHKYEVTNGQYKLCVTYGNCTIPLEHTDFQNPIKQNYPVAFVTLFQANNFCQWLGLRLPTEVEWERAARGPDGKSWPWGNQSPSPEFVNMPASGTYQPTEGLQPVNSNTHAISPENVYNLVGNVSEWTSSFLYTGGKYDMSHWDGISENFKGTALYSTRGGGWANQIEYVSQITPNVGTDVREDLGFRCASDIK